MPVNGSAGWREMGSLQRMIAEDGATEDWKWCPRELRRKISEKKERKWTTTVGHKKKPQAQ
jgi:hypothetical protein